MEQNNWWSVADRCKEMLRKNYPVLCELFNAQPICPVSEDFLGQIASLPLPINDPAPLKKILFEKYKIEIPVFKLRDQVYLRLSTQAYVSQEDIDALIAALKEIKEETAIFN